MDYRFIHTPKTGGSSLKSKKQYTLTEEEIELVKDKCSLDFKLYNAFKANGKSINKRRTKSL